MSKYAALDTRIVNAIRRSPCSFEELIRMTSVISEADPFYSNRVDRERLIDRRLQHLRKAGLIRFEHGYWRPVRRV
jgi:hypothetical protein